MICDKYIQPLYFITEFGRRIPSPSPGGLKRWQLIHERSHFTVLFECRSSDRVHTLHIKIIQVMIVRLLSSAAMVPLYAFLIYVPSRSTGLTPHNKLRTIMRIVYVYFFAIYSSFTSRNLLE